jgi:hypothetical protein
VYLPEHYSNGNLDSSGNTGNFEDSQDPGAEVTLEVLEDIGRIVNKYGNEKCVECANEIENYLKEHNIRGERIKLDTPKLTRYDGFIYDNSLTTESDAIATNGHYESIEITVNGEKRVFDNHRPNGSLTEQYVYDLYEFLSWIKKRPGMYLRTASITRLDMVLRGYALARREVGLTPTKEEREFEGFQSWVQEQYGIKSNQLWAKIILFFSIDEREALKRIHFFDFLKLIDGNDAIAT